jgi:hypothetical protein
MNVSKMSLALGLMAIGACARQPETRPDPRVGLKAGMFDAEEALGNLKKVSTVPPPERHRGATNSDLAFTGNYAIQGNYNGLIIWDISNPSQPVLKASYYCPASQNDVSVYKHLLFMSSEGGSSRLDCGPGGIRDTVSAERMRGIRIFDITDMANPKLVGNVQTCRGSHTHTVLEHPGDRDNVYVYVSGSAGIRSPNELPGCFADPNNPETANFRIEVIRVPLANPAAAAIVGSPRIFSGLGPRPSRTSEAPEDRANRLRQIAEAKARGGFVYIVPSGPRKGEEAVLSGFQQRPLIDSALIARGAAPGGTPTAVDSAWIRANLQRILDVAAANARPNPNAGRLTQCHDITVYPALGLAGGACEGMGLLLDIKDPVNPVRIDAVADTNFSYWHSATLNNDGTAILFSDEWGGGGSPKCRATDPKEWGANAIFKIGPDRKMRFQSYYKMPAVQTAFENCVAHNGSLIPIPDRDVMVQSWYQGGVSIFDWSDPARPFEIAYQDYGPSDSTRQGAGGTWSAYWYNGAIYSSEIARGFDIFELTPSEHLSQNEIDAAKTVRFDHFNAQGQPKFVWPPSFPLARAYVDQLERKNCVPKDRIASMRAALSTAEAAGGTQRRDALITLATQVDGMGPSSCDQRKMSKLAQATRALAGLQP